MVVSKCTTCFKETVFTGPLSVDLVWLDCDDAIEHYICGPCHIARIMEVAND